MREIKFRAWDRLQKRMFSGDEILGPKPSFEVVPTTPSNYRLNEYFKGLSMFALDWMQFTGLKDKNGKEIYEGDILAKAYGKLEPLMVGEKKAACIVSFKKGHFICESTATLGRPDYLSILADQMEIIGNIYENSELLNQSRLTN